MKPMGIVTAAGEFVRADVLDQYAVKSETSRQLPTQDTFAGHKGLIQPKYDPAHLISLLETNTAHQVACRQKSEDVLGRGWEFVKTRDDARPEDRDRLAAWFEDIPAPETALSSLAFRSVFGAAQFDFESVGRGAFEIVRTDKIPGGPIETIVHAPGHTMRVHRDGKRFVQSRGGRRRWFKWAGADIDVDYEDGETYDLGALRPERRANEIVWWTNYHPADTVYGLPDIIPAVGAVHGDMGRRDYNLEFFSNFGIPSYAVLMTGDFDPGDFVDKDGEVVGESDPNGKWEAEWHIESLLKQVRENPHSSLVFTVPTREGAEDAQVSIEFEPLATDIKEASFRMYRKDNREEVLSSHRMSAAIAGVYDAGAANREARSQYKQSVIWPRRSTLELVVNHFIVPAFGDIGWKAQLKPLDNRDAQDKLELAVKAVHNGGMTPREFRSFVAPIIGFDPEVTEADDDPALDRFYVNGRELGAADDEVGGELRSMRDDLATMAIKSDAGHLPSALAKLLQVGAPK